MEFIFEFIGELLLEGSIELSTNKKISKYIRYPLLLIILLFFSAVIFGMLFLGIFLLKKSILAGLMFIAISLFLLIGSIIKIKKNYINKKTN